MPFPADEESVKDELMKACAAVDGSKWERVAIDLGISSNKQNDIKEFIHDHFLRMYKVLELWKNQSESPTVGKLLQCFDRCDIGRRAIKEKFEERVGRPR